MARVRFQFAALDLFDDVDEPRIGARFDADLLALAHNKAIQKLDLGAPVLHHVLAHRRTLFGRTALAAKPVRVVLRERLWIAGVVASARVQMTRRGRMMAVLLEDAGGQVEVTVFNELFEKHRDKIREDRLLVVQGKVQRDEFSGGQRVTAEDVLDLAALRTRFGARLRIEMNGGTDAGSDPKRLMDLLAPYRAPGREGCPVLVHYENAGASCDVALGETWRVRPDELLLGELTAWLSPEAVQFQYAGAAP